MNNTIFGIKLITWALILSWLLNSALWIGFPQFMLRTGTSYVIMGIFCTLIFVKVKSFSKQEWADNFFHLKKQLPLLIYMLAMGILIHRFLETTYWAPKRLKTMQEIRGNMTRRKVSASSIINQPGSEIFPIEMLGTPSFSPKKD
ncbi:hypothetical protein [Dyadobacter arcticus]|uniref:Uncharacterized protein n=1 Tax=Dyadobacter arcticus TaxID=1078754 RepID=A0ABX0UGF8_9BACT|nr:hypothetical protein [Dyadobacter arcticus]NIJ51129.1 hypothetical protein [Dyadobacter arcticus]